MTETIDKAPAERTGDLSKEDLFPIREVSRMTGVNPVTLRAWERRYGLLVPHRTPSGHRLYSMADIERVRAVMSWIERGVAVSKVASIIDRQVAVAQERSADAGVAAQAPEDETWQLWQARLIDAVNAFDRAALDHLYGQLHSSFPLSVVFQDIVLPVWKLFRQGGEAGVSSGQWSFLDAFLRGRLFQRMSYTQPGLPDVMLVTLPGVHEEFEVLMAASFVLAAGANITYVPAVPTFSELGDMAQRSGCAALVLYGSKAADSELLLKHLPRLEQALECPVAMLGALSEAQPAELQAAGILALGDSGAGVTAKMRGVLGGRLDT
ncbi:MAG: MerR family transcriptional regulator [Pseudomonas sp.]